MSHIFKLVRATGDGVRKGGPLSVELVKGISFFLSLGAIPKSVGGTPVSKTFVLGAYCEPIGSPQHRSIVNHPYVLFPIDPRGLRDSGTHFPELSVIKKSRFLFLTPSPRGAISLTS